MQVRTTSVTIVTIVTNDNNPKCVRIILLLYIYLYIIVIFLLTHKIVFVILSYCHTNACMPQGERHSSCLQKTRNQHPEKYVSLPAKDSFPARRKQARKKTFPFNRFLHLSPTCGFAFSAKSRIFVSADKRAGSPFFEPPHKKTGAIPLHFPAGIFPQT